MLVDFPHGWIIIRRSEFDSWLLHHRHVGSADVDRLVAEVFAHRPERAH
jgi:hypothetical protein